MEKSTTTTPKQKQKQEITKITKKQKNGRENKDPKQQSLRLLLQNMTGKETTFGVQNTPTRTTTRMGETTTVPKQQQKQEEIKLTANKNNENKQPKQQDLRLLLQNMKKKETTRTKPQQQQQHNEKQQQDTNKNSNIETTKEPANTTSSKNTAARRNVVTNMTDLKLFLARKKLERAQKSPQITRTSNPSEAQPSHRPQVSQRVHQTDQRGEISRIELSPTIGTTDIAAKGINI